VIRLRIESHFTAAPVDRRGRIMAEGENEMFLRVFILIAATATAIPVQADVVEYTDADVWQSAVNGTYSTIDFTGFPDGTPITNQYANQGVTFTGPEFTFASTGFVNDGWGLHGPAGVHFTFDSPQNCVAVDYPGGVKFQLFSQGVLVYTSTFFQPGGLGNFAGLVSDVGFDEVYLYKRSGFPNDVFIDDLHWGAIPAPSAIGLFLIASLPKARRRRP